MNSATRTGEPRIRQEPARLVPAAAAPELHPVLDQYSRSQDQLGHMLPVCVTPRRRLTCRQSSGDFSNWKKANASVASQTGPLAGFGPNEWLVEELYQSWVEDPSTLAQARFDFFYDY